MAQGSKRPLIILARLLRLLRKLLANPGTALRESRRIAIRIAWHSPGTIEAHKEQYEMAPEFTTGDDRDRLPTHPGEVLREGVLPSLGLSVGEAARQLRISRQTLPQLIRQHNPTAPSRLEKWARPTGSGC